ncbi:MAG: hypothetical protein ACHQ4H_09340 [Ktedonobacterales bacterium]
MIPFPSQEPAIADAPHGPPLQPAVRRRARRDDVVVRVTPVRGRRDLSKWIRFPRRRVYARDSPWVPPLDSDLRRMVDPRRNPYFRHADARLVLARDHRGHVLGRALLHVNHRHNVRHDERAAFFGFFECLDDPQAARALVAAATEYGAQHGCTVLRGPFNLTVSQEMGILVDGFDEPPTVDLTYTAPYYPALLEAAGLHAVFPVTTFRTDDLSELDPEAMLGPRQHAWRAGGRLRIRTARLDAFEEELELIREISNDAFYDSPYFVSLTRAEFRFQVAPYQRLLDPDLTLIAEIDGVPCGFVIATPDFSPLLRRMRGRSGLRELVIFRRGRAAIHDAVGTFMGVQRHLRSHGVMRLLQSELVRALKRRHYRSLTITWMSEENGEARAMAAVLRGRPVHRLVLYEGQIPAPDDDPAATPTMEATQADGIDKHAPGG